MDPDALFAEASKSILAPIFQSVRARMRACQRWQESVFWNTPQDTSQDTAWDSVRSDVFFFFLKSQFMKKP